MGIEMFDGEKMFFGSGRIRGLPDRNPSQINML